MIEAKDRKFYYFMKGLGTWIFKLIYQPKIEGLENIPNERRILLAGNHTKWLDPLLIIASSKRQVHFLAKDELFHGATKFIVEKMGCIPVNRRIHDKDALENTYRFLENDLCIGIFPEGTINRTDDIIMPFKMGAVKACSKTNSKLVPFVITGKYKLFRKSVKIEFLKPINIGKDLEKENNKLMKIISSKLEEGNTK